MGACTSGPQTPPRRRSLTEEQRAMQHKMIMEQQREQEREMAERINREKMNLRNKALPMIMKRASCEEISFIDVSQHSDADFDEAIMRHRSRSNSDASISKEGDSELGQPLSSLGDDASPDVADDSSVHDKSRMLEKMENHWSVDENDSMAVLRANKQMKRRRAKQDAESENKWMIFRDLDAFDEADMVKVAKFMESLFKVKSQLDKDSSRGDALLALGALEAPAAAEANVATTSEARRLLDAPPHSPDRLGSDSPDWSDGGASGKKAPYKSEGESDIEGSSSDHTNDDAVGIKASRTVSASSVLASPERARFPSFDNSHADLPPAPSRSASIDAGSRSPILHLSPASTPISKITTSSGVKLERLKSPAQTFGTSLGSGGDDDGLITLQRENSMESLLRRGQVVITPTTAMGSRSPATTPKTPLPPSPRASPKISKNKHSDVIKNEMNANFDLQNFRLPSGFITPLVSKAVVDVYKQGGKLSKESVHKLLRLCYRAFQTLPNTSPVNVGEDERLTIIGDIHGQLSDLLYILGQSGLPNKKNKYIFNGDFVDRGAYGVEVMCILMALYLSNPGQVTLNRGNHEDFAICCAYGFQAECCTKYDDVTFGMFVEVFNHLPLFAVVNERIFVLHGGLFHTADVKLAELNLIKRTDFSLKDIPDGGEGTDNIPRNRQDDFLKQLQRDALWSDPSRNDGLNVSARGAGVMFGPDIARKFCELNNISLVVRSHECCRTGFDLPYANAINEDDRGTVCTIFSASNYGGGGNSAAYMVFSKQESTKKKKERTKAESHVKTSVTDVPRTDLQYEVNYFHIDDNEDELWMRAGASDSEYETDDDTASIASSQVSLTGDLSLHQLILRKRKLLLKSFELADPSMTGFVLKETWAQVMQRVLSLHISWITMFPALVDEDSISYLTYDRGNRIDPTAVEGTTAFVSYERFLDHFSLSMETATDFDSDEEEGEEADAVDDEDGDVSDGEGDVGVLEQPVCKSAEGAAQKNSKVKDPKKRNVSGQLVDSLYAHHNELSAIFSFFDMKKDEVISRAEFRAGCRIIRKLQREENGEKAEASEDDANTDEKEEGEEEFDDECDQLMEIMNLNGSGFIDINEFFEMFRVSEAMRRRTEQDQPMNMRRRGSKSTQAQGINVGGVVIKAE